MLKSLVCVVAICKKYFSILGVFVEEHLREDER